MLKEYWVDSNEYRMDQKGIEGIFSGTNTTLLLSLKLMGRVGLNGTYSKDRERGD